MPNYWLGIMAVAFAAAMALWITLVFRAGRSKPHQQQPQAGPHREVIGGAFDAREGGRQVMPDPGAPLVPETDRTESPGTSQRRSSLASTVRTSTAILEQRNRGPGPGAARAGPRRPGQLLAWPGDAALPAGAPQTRRAMMTQGEYRALPGLCERGTQVVKNIIKLIVLAGAGVALALGWPDIIRYVRIQRATIAGGHPEQIPAGGRTVYPQSHAAGALDGTGDFDSASRGGPALR